MAVKRLAAALAAALTIFITPYGARAQAFFATLVGDPATATERASTARIPAVTKPTGIATFSSTGAEPIGPYVGGVAYAWPGLLATGDQFDAIAILGGPSADGRAELLAGGLGYRMLLGDTGTTLYGAGDYGDYRLGTAAFLPRDAGGHVQNVSFGLRRSFQVGAAAPLAATLEFNAHGERAHVGGTTIVDEDLRTLRLAVAQSFGKPFGVQTRWALSLTKGIPDFGASAKDKARASLPGATTDFTRVAFRVETSRPLGGRFLVNAGIIGQWSDDALPLSQRCGYGTNDYARGFDRSYVNGDGCFGGRVELAYDFARPAPGDTVPKRTQAFVGIDHGKVWNNAFSRSDRWSSASIGVRALHGRFLGEVSLTRILALPSGTTPQRKIRLWFQTAMRF